ncbi:MAG TPA: copper resistance protein CopC, partial [Acidimicrobiales bacterium]|nr:copper resistance protein CopC [Acidimicrobiales bacterium]
MRVTRPRRLVARRRGVAILLLTLVAALAPATSASAHASLVSTDPVSGSQLATGPSTVTLTFSEAVTVPSGAIRVLDARGARVEQGRVTHPGGAPSKVAVAVPRLGAGAYVVTWRVVSDDSHPVQGTFTFAVGAAAPGAAAEAAGAAMQPRGDRALGVAYGVVRFLVFASLLVLVGSVAFVSVLWPAGSTDRRTARIVWGSFLVLALGTLVSIGLQGAYGPGLGLLDAVKPSTLQAALDTRYGVMAAGRLLLLVGSIPLLAIVVSPYHVGGVTRGALAVMGLALIATVSLAGHAGAGPALAVALPFDLLHVGAASVWVGGLVVLVGVVLPRRGDAGDDVAGDH